MLIFVAIYFSFLLFDVCFHAATAVADVPEPSADAATGVEVPAEATDGVSTGVEVLPEAADGVSTGVEVLPEAADGVSTAVFAPRGYPPMPSTVVEWRSASSVGISTAVCKATRVGVGCIMLAFAVIWLLFVSFIG